MIYNVTIPISGVLTISVDAPEGTPDSDIYAMAIQDADLDTVSESRSGMDQSIDLSTHKHLVSGGECFADVWDWSMEEA